LNSVNYCKQVMHEWGQQLIFLELRFEQLRTKSPEVTFMTLTGTVFDHLIGKYSNLKKKIQIDLVDVIYQSFLQTSRGYWKKRIWREHLSLGTAWNSFDVSPEFAESLSFLKERLDLVQYYLSTTLFLKFWMQALKKLNEYIYAQISSKFHFTKHGIHQFNHDMKSLLLLFKPFTPHPENFFKEVKEACLVFENAEEIEELLLTKGWTRNLMSQYGIFTLDSQQISSLLSSYIK